MLALKGVDKKRETSVQPVRRKAQPPTPPSRTVGSLPVRAGVQAEAGMPQRESKSPVVTWSDGR